MLPGTPKKYKYGHRRKYSAGFQVVRSFISRHRHALKDKVNVDSNVRIWIYFRSAHDRHDGVGIRGLDGGREGKGPGYGDKEERSLEMRHGAGAAFLRHS